MVIATIIEYFPRATLCVLLSFVPHNIPTCRLSHPDILYAVKGDHLPQVMVCGRQAGTQVCLADSWGNEPHWQARIRATSYEGGRPVAFCLGLTTLAPACSCPLSGEQGNCLGSLLWKCKPPRLCGTLHQYNFVPFLCLYWAVTTQ